jgi:hypothetical protein
MEVMANKTSCTNQLSPPCPPILGGSALRVSQNSLREALLRGIQASLNVNRTGASEIHAGALLNDMKLTN